MALVGGRRGSRRFERQCGCQGGVGRFGSGARWRSHLGRWSELSHAVKRDGSRLNQPPGSARTGPLNAGWRIWPTFLVQHRLAPACRNPTSSGVLAVRCSSRRMEPQSAFESISTSRSSHTSLYILASLIGGMCLPTYSGLELRSTKRGTRSRPVYQCCAVSSALGQSSPPEIPSDSPAVGWRPTSSVS